MPEKDRPGQGMAAEAKDAKDPAAEAKGEEPKAAEAPPDQDPAAQAPAAEEPAAQAPPAQDKTAQDKPAQGEGAKLNPDSDIEAAEALFRGGRVKKAEEALKAIITADPGRLRAWRSLAAGFHYQGQRDMAVAAF